MSNLNRLRDAMSNAGYEAAAYRVDERLYTYNEREVQQRIAMFEKRAKR